MVATTVGFVINPLPYLLHIYFIEKPMYEEVGFRKATSSSYGGVSFSTSCSSSS
jgi:hypothetical protein